MYKDWLSSSSNGPVLAKSGEYEIRQSEAYFARENLTVLTGEEISKLPLNSRRLALTALMLRRLAVQEGLKNDIFSTPDAREYILPRLEKIMEEYYYYKLSQEAAWSGRLRSIKDDEQAIDSFINSDPDLKKRHIERTDLSATISSAVERVIAEKRVIEYSRVKQQILSKNPPIEVIQ
jgi:hypothetical protein